MHVVNVSQILLKRPSFICPFENNKFQVLFLYKGQRSTFSEVFSTEDTEQVITLDHPVCATNKHSVNHLRSLSSRCSYRTVTT